MISDNNEVNIEEPIACHKQQSPKKKFNWEPVLAIGTIVLAFFTFLLWLDTHKLAVDAEKTEARQAKDTQDSFALTKQAADAATQAANAASSSVNETKRLIDAAETSARIGESQLRAYVNLNVSYQAWPSPPKPPNRAAFSLDITNNGKTWPNNLTIKYYGTEVAKGEEDNVFKSQDWGKLVALPLVLPPGHTRQIQFFEIPVANMEVFLKGNKSIVLVAIAHYEEKVNHSIVKRQSQMNLELHIDSEGSFSFSELHTHNCVDDECNKYN